MNAPGGPAGAFRGGARRSEFSASDRRKMQQLSDRALRQNKRLREQRARQARAADSRGSDKSDRPARKDAEARR